MRNFDMFKIFLSQLLCFLHYRLFASGNKFVVNCIFTRMPRTSLRDFFSEIVFGDILFRQALDKIALACKQADESSC